jgi:hypothetical protein
VASNRSEFGLDERRNEPTGEDISHRCIYLKAATIVASTEVHALYMPPGCIHGTFTTGGGFVVTSEFTTKDAECTEVALQNRGATEAVRGWIKICETLRRRARKRPTWRRDAEKCWTPYLESEEAENFLCVDRPQEVSSRRISEEHMPRGTRRKLHSDAEKGEKSP